MATRKRDKKKVDPLTGAEEKDVAAPLKTVPPNEPANASTATIPGTGKPVRDVDGKEVKRIVRT